MWYLANYLAKNDCEITIVTSNGFNFGNLGFPDLPSNVRVVYVNDPVKKAMQKRVSALRSDSPPSGLKSRSILMAKKVSSFFAFPDYAIFALPSYYIALKKILDGNPGSTLIVSAPSHSLFLLFVLLSRYRGRGVKLVADYRDGWNATAIFAKDGFCKERLSLFLELSVCRIADSILFATNSMRENTQKLFATVDIFAKSHVVMNGYPEKFFNSGSSLSKRDSTKKFRIGYFGVANDQLKSYRNIEPILVFLKNLMSQGFNFVLELYGDIRISRIDLLKYDFVELKGNVSHSEAIRIMRELDCLLMYHLERKGASEVITGKFFDYVCACRPILCVSPLDMEGALMVKNGGFGRVADFEDQDQIFKAFSEIYCGEVMVDPMVATAFSRESQYAKILPLLN